MTMRNVGIVFSPTLGIPAGVFSLMLGEFNRVFNVDDGNITPDGDEEGLSARPPSLNRRNSRQYTDNAADELLGLSGRTLTSALYLFRQTKSMLMASLLLLAPAEEGQSESGDDDSVQYESGTETTDDATMESSSSVRVSPPDTPLANKVASKASSAAASKGLNIAVTHSDRGNRYSRMGVGLPSSPRPLGSPIPSSPAQ